MREKIREYYWALTTQFGINLLQTFRGLRALPAFIADYTKFRRNYLGSMRLMPCLHDKHSRAGDAQSEYFLQDLHVAKRVFENNPTRHVDVGSRIDGFVAHIASFRSIEVFDIRPITDNVAGIVFRQEDLTKLDPVLIEYCDSLSCLHALEHFGLGRYGDKVDPLGWIQGLISLARLLKPFGRLFLSVPVGRELVVFNAHRVFSPARVVAAAKEQGLAIASFCWIADGRLRTSADFPGDMEAVGRSEYALGIFEFLKQ